MVVHFVQRQGPVFIDPKSHFDASREEKKEYKWISGAAVKAQRREAGRRDSVIDDTPCGPDLFTDVLSRTIIKPIFSRWTLSGGHERWTAQLHCPSKNRGQRMKSPRNTWKLRRPDML